MGRRFERLSQSSPAFRCGLLGLSGLLVLAVVAPWAAYSRGLAGLAAAGAAGGVCLAGALMALLASHALRRSPLYAMLVAMILRMGIPLALALVVQLRGGTLVDNGFLYCLLVFYPVTLAVETALSLPPREPAGTGPRASQPTVDG